MIWSHDGCFFPPKQDGIKPLTIPRIKKGKHENRKGAQTQKQACGRMTQLKQLLVNQNVRSTNFINILAAQVGQ